MSRSVKNACSVGASAVIAVLSERASSRAAASAINSGAADRYQ